MKVRASGEETEALTLIINCKFYLAERTGRTRP